MTVGMVMLDLAVLGQWQRCHAGCIAYIHVSGTGAFGDDILPARLRRDWLSRHGETRPVIGYRDMRNAMRDVFHVFRFLKHWR